MAGSVGIWKLDSWDGEGFEIWANDVKKKLIVKAQNNTKVCRCNDLENLLLILSYKLTVIGTDLIIIKR